METNKVAYRLFHDYPVEPSLRRAHCGDLVRATSKYRVRRPVLAALVVLLALALVPLALATSLAPGVPTPSNGEVILKTPYGLMPAEYRPGPS